MDERRMSYGATVRLALIFSAIAALVAMALESIGDVSTIRLVVAVTVIGFVISWIHTGRVARTTPATTPATTRHRVTVMPMRQPIG